MKLNTLTRQIIFLKICNWGLVLIKYLNSIVFIYLMRKHSFFCMYTNNNKNAFYINIKTFIVITFVNNLNINMWLIMFFFFFWRQSLNTTQIHSLGYFPTGITYVLLVHYCIHSGRIIIPTYKIVNIKVYNKKRYFSKMGIWLLPLRSDSNILYCFNFLIYLNIK